MIYVRSPQEAGMTRVLLVPGLTAEAARRGASWLERIDGRLYRIHAYYTHDTGGVPVLVERERAPAPAGEIVEGLARRVDRELGGH